MPEQNASKLCDAAQTYREIAVQLRELARRCWVKTGRGELCSSRAYLSIELSALTTADGSHDRRDARMGVAGNGRPLGVHDVAAAAEAVALRAASGAHDNPHSERSRRSRLTSITVLPP